MIIDANGFIGKWPYWPVASSSAPEVVSELHRYKIDAAAICSTRSVFVHWEDGNCEVEAAVALFPGSLIPFACLGTRDSATPSAIGPMTLRPMLPAASVASGFIRSITATTCSSSRSSTRSSRPPPRVAGPFFCP